MQVILDSLFARPGSAPIGGGKKGEFRDWTTGSLFLNAAAAESYVLFCLVNFRKYVSIPEQTFLDESTS